MRDEIKEDANMMTKYERIAEETVSQLLMACAISGNEVYYKQVLNSRQEYVSRFAKELEENRLEIKDEYAM